MQHNPASFPAIISLEKGHPDYPIRLAALLGNKAPATLYCQGNLQLLTQAALGFCGSRNVTQKGLEIARDCAHQAAARNKVVISGNARGVDRMVHMTALESGGNTIFVLPEGINHFRVNKDLRPFWDWQRALVLSEFPPQQPWKAWNAMKRNKTILSLVSAMIVIEAGEKGGTIAAGKDALAMGVPLFVINRTDMDASIGGRQLLDMGGRKLQKSPLTGKANMGPVMQTMAGAPHTAGMELQYSLL